MEKEFSQFLKKLVDQNSIQMAEQAVGVKYQREVAKEDDDKREKQLDTVNENLVKIKETLVKDTKEIKVLPKNISSELGKKLNDYKLKETDKTGVEQIQELVGALKTGLASITGGFKGGADLFQGTKNKLITATQTVKDIINTPAGFTAEKERFAKAFVRTPEGSRFQPGGKSGLEVGREKYDQIVSKEKQIKDVESRIKTSTDYGFKPVQKDVDELNSLKKQLAGLDPRVKKQTISEKNPESDNVVTPLESLSDSFKQDLTLSKELLDTTRRQLVELQTIREVLAPKTPSELKEGVKPVAIPEKEEAPSTGSSIGQAISSIGKGALSVGKKVLSAPGTKLGRLAGGAIAVGTGAFAAYQGWSKAEETKQSKLDEVQNQLDAGQITPAQAADKRNEIGNTATIEKGGAVGEGTGIAAGGIAGMKVGAAIGSVLGPIGTGVGALAGGALGAFAGSKAGKVVGEYGGKAVNAVKNFFSPAKEQPAAAIVPTIPGPTLRERFEAMRPSASTGAMVNRTSVENSDLARQNFGDQGPRVPVIANNISNNNNTSYVPMKPSPRPEYSGSALDRYQSRVAVY